MKEYHLTTRSPYGDSQSSVPVEPGHPDPGERLLILIHGYQNSEDDAHHAYLRFQERLRGVMPTGGLGSIGEVWEFHWPGDHPRFFLSVFTYSARVESARVSGIYLADHLKRLPGRRVHIVAHSLGCRVALSAISAIDRKIHDGDYGGAEIGEVFLLAAAVPAHECETKEGRPFPRALSTSREHVLYSRRDLVLRPFFGIGQGAFGSRAPAVGHGGLPYFRWTVQLDTALGHGKYWSSRDVAEIVGAAFSTNVPRTSPARWLPEYERSSAARWLEAHFIPRVPLASRFLA